MKRAGFAAAAAASVALLAALSWAQRLDPKRSTTFRVGPPAGACPAVHVDARRTGLSRTPLPRGTLHASPPHAVGSTCEGAPLVDARGNVVVATGKGEILTLDESDLGERAHPGIVGAPAIASPALLSDGTAVIVNAPGDVIGVKDGALRFRTRVFDGRLPPSAASLLSLDDGGFAVLYGSELATVDGRGMVRARASLDEPGGAPLVAGPDGILTVLASGNVVSWSPGRAPARVGSFGGSIDGAASLVGPRALVGVVGGTDLVELDLSRGVAVTRASSQALLFGPAAFVGETAYLLSSAPGRTFAIALDAAGKELFRAVLVTSPFVATDAGVSPSPVPTHIGLLVDASGTIAFATPEGRVGIATADGSVDLLGDTYCPKAQGPGRGQPTATGAVFAGLAPAGAGAFVVACEDGTVFKVTAAGP